MKRREFITLLGGAAAAWPLAAHAQQSGKALTVGFLGTSSSAEWSTFVDAFAGRLRELGWIERSTIVIEYRWAEGLNERHAEIATEFARLNVDVIVTSGAAVVAARHATSSRIPIVFAVANDPLGTGLVASLERPGGNTTGLSNQSADLGAKRLELLREVAPGIRRLAIMGNGDYRAATVEMGELRTTARTLGLEAVTVELRRAEDVGPAFEALKGRADALYVVSDGLLMANRVQINAFALAARLPTVHAIRDYVGAGGLMSYGPNYPDMFRRAAELVDKILRGTKPLDIPVEQPTKFDLVFNLKTAKALGIEIPSRLLFTANEVIE